MKPAFYYLLSAIIVLSASCKKEETINNIVTPDPYAYVDGFCGKYDVHITDSFYSNGVLTGHHDTDVLMIIVNTHKTASPSKGSEVPVVDFQYEGGASIHAYYLDTGGFLGDTRGSGRIQNGHITASSDAGIPAITHRQIITGDKRK